jgi:hypothetical protein
LFTCGAQNCQIILLWREQVHPDPLRLLQYMPWQTVIELEIQVKCFFN